MPIKILMSLLHEYQFIEYVFGPPPVFFFFGGGGGAVKLINRNG